MKLRVSTRKGMLSVEQLWDLSMTALAEEIKQLSAQKKANLAATSDVDFLEENAKTEDTPEEMAFEILKVIYLTKKAEANEAKERANAREFNTKIAEIIERKKNAKLEDMSIEELQDMLKK